MKLSFTFRHVAVLVSAFLCEPLLAQQDPHDIIRKSFDAHGGVYGTDSLKVHFRFSCKNRINEGQSYVTQAPFDTYITDDEVWIDKPAKRSVYKTMGTLAGGHVETHIISFSNGRGYNLNVKYKNYFEIQSIPNPRQLSQNFLLKAALADLSKVRFIDESAIDGRAAYHLKFDTVDLFINKSNYLVERITRTWYEPYSGKGSLSTSFADYQKAGKAMIPAKYITQKTNMVYGTIVNSYDITDIRSGFEIPAELFIVPNDYTSPPPGTKDCEATKLADGLYVIESIEGKGGAYQILVAEFSDYLLVTEAPLDVATSNRVIKKLNGMFPSKPIRYVVQSHSHYDHIGGILGYTEQNSTVVASEDAGGVVNRMHKAFEQSSGRSWKKPVLKLVKGRVKIEDKTNSCVVYNIGPNSHSRQILVTWFPKQRVLYQADVFGENESDLPSVIEFTKEIKKLKLDIDAVVPAHGSIARGKEIAHLVR